MQITLAVFPDATDPAGLTGLLDQIRAAEQAGFARVWLPQLPHIPDAPEPWDALTVLALAGKQTSRIGLGTGVVVAYGQHPLTLARQALTADAATGGRLTLGIGVGHAQFVEPLGYTYDRPAAYLREYLAELTPALPRTPVLVAALGPRMLDIAGTLTDGTVTSWTGPKALEEHIIPRITAAAAAAGRPAPQIIAGLPVLITDKADAARELIAGQFAMAATAPAYRDIARFWTAKVSPAPPMSASSATRPR